jgi:hypothetical protein
LADVHYYAKEYMSPLMKVLGGKFEQAQYRPHSEVDFQREQWQDVAEAEALEEPLIGVDVAAPGESAENVAAAQEQQAGEIEVQDLLAQVFDDVKRFDPTITVDELISYLG